MNTPEFTNELDLWREKVEKEINRLVPSSGTEPQTLHRAMRHSLEAGGKRIRPILVCAVARCFNENTAPLPAAVAIECLHTYTLIHDDLPAMDNSDLRRGRPTCHKEFGEAAAILAGDALLTLSFEILSSSYSNSPSLANFLIRDLAVASGSRRLVGGQMEDIENAGLALSTEKLSSINRKKTGALLAAACIMGARIGQANEAQLALVRQFGALLGESFQVIDDILDYTASAEQTGKSSGRDAANGKVTLASIEGIDSARNRATFLTQESLNTLSNIQGNTAFLESLVRWLEQRAS